MVLFLLLACGALREDRCGKGMDFSSAFYGDTEFHAGGDWEGDAEIYIFLDVIDGKGEGSVQSDAPLTFQGKAIPAHRSLPLQVDLCWEGDDGAFIGTVYSEYVDDLELQIGGEQHDKHVWMLHQTDIEREYMELYMEYYYCDEFFLDEGDEC